MLFITSSPFCLSHILHAVHHKISILFITSCPCCSWLVVHVADGKLSVPLAADPSKRRNVVLNEKELLVPLEHGWRRQTTIHGMGRRGIVGEVLYFAPCNKKMKTIPDVMRVSCRDVLLGTQCGL